MINLISIFQITCTREEFLDLSLTLKQASDAALERNFSQISLEDDASEDEPPPHDTSVRLADLLNFWVLPTKLDGENAFACENCPKTEGSSQKIAYRPAIQQFAIEALPPILLFHLQRFIFQGEAHGKRRLSKDNRHVAAPLILDMGPYVSRTKQPADCEGSPTKKSSLLGSLVRRKSSVKSSSTLCTEDCLPGSSFRYELQAMVVHEGGSTESGHYIAIVRSRQGLWIRISDESVRVIDPRQVPQHNPYLLFYRRIDCCS